MTTKTKTEALQFEDTITQLVFNTSDQLIASSWDGTIALLSLSTNLSLSIPAPQSFPQLDCSILKTDNDKIVSVGIDNNINIFSKTKSSLISSISIETANNLFKLASTDCFLITADRNKSLYVYDDKSNKLCGSYKTDKQLSQMKLIDNKSIVCPDKDSITFYDLRQMNKPYMTIPNIMKADIASIGYIPKEAMLYGSNEGKIAVEYITTSNNTQNYSFKCHRIENETTTNVYSVNAIEYDVNKNVFYSGGSEGYIYSWDNKKRKKVFKSQKYPEPISHLTINNSDSNSLLAVGVSWLFENAEFDLNNNHLHKHYVDIIDLKGR